MSKIRVAINGFGRIGRAFFRLASLYNQDHIEIVAINDLGDIHNLAYLLQYDSAQGFSGLRPIVDEQKGTLTLNNSVIKVLQERDPAALPWGQHNIDVVIEATGVFRDYSKAKLHLDAGAKRVVISAPAKGEPVPGVNSATVLMGINDDKLATCQISSNASCTTNAGSPVVAIMQESLGIEKALLNTIHAYTATQAIVDGPSKKDFRKGRAAAQNIVPTTTGAAIATTKAITALEGKFDGIATRVPVVCGSLVDITFVSTRDTTVEEVNAILSESAQEERWRKIFAVTTEPVVSSDIVGARFASIADLSMTKVVDNNLVKILAWYDNEIGYTQTLVEHVINSGRHATEQA